MNLLEKKGSTGDWKINYLKHSFKNFIIKNMQVFRGFIETQGCFKFSCVNRKIENFANNKYSLSRIYNTY